MTAPDLSSSGIACRHPWSQGAFPRGVPALAGSFA
jgi:hypothetical protein